MITVDDIVHIISEEAGEDTLRLAGAGDGDINEPIRLTVRTRFTWLVVNLGTAMVASSVVGLFQGTIASFALLAVLMPIVSGNGRQCRHADARRGGPRTGDQPADEFEHRADDRPRVPHRGGEWRHAGRADRTRDVSDLPQYQNLSIVIAAAMLTNNIVGGA